jgi:hypothetical protein
MTGFGAVDCADYREMLQRFGANDVLPKPFNLAVLW